MKKLFRCILASALIAALGITMVACGGGKKTVQGVDTENHVIKVGNTAATTGAFASVGVPFNYAQEAYFWYFENQTEGYVDEEGNKYSIDFVHYDDGFDGAVGATLTEKLVEEDEVFALVGHFGSNTVGATVEYIEEQGIPMVYGVCGVSQLYDTEENVMTVQPIYNTEGSAMVASAFATKEDNLGLGATKLGVISTTDEAGMGMLEGIKLEVNKLGKGTSVVYQAVGASDADYTSAVTALKTAGCDVVIIAANQAPFTNIMNAFITVDYDNVSVITSYVSANYAAMGGLVGSGAITNTRVVYAGAWLVTGSVPDPDFKGWNDFVQFAKVITLYDTAKGTTLLTTEDATYGAYIKLYFGDQDWAANGVSANFLNSYAMAGYVSANVFCQGLARMSGEKLTWKAFIDAMEEAPVDVPMGGTVNYANGNRVGIESLALNLYTANNLGVGEVYRGITSTGDLEAAIQ